MRGSTRPLLAVAVLLAALVAQVRAADSGTVSGAVFDQAGQPVVGATVTITGDQVPAGRSAKTGENGTFLLDYVAPGDYVIVFNQPGVGTLQRRTRVDVGRDTQIDTVLGVALTEQLTVTAAAPTIDVRSSEVSFNFKAETLSTLPLDRTYRGLFQLIPGVADNRSTVGPSAGGTRQDNIYLIDGANITNPGFGYLTTEVNELDIAEVNLKRAGISAEFGRTAGTVINVVSRSGSNQPSAVGRMDWLSRDFVQTSRLPAELLNAGILNGTFRDPVLTTELSPGLAASGPIVRDRVFIYGSARLFRETKWNRVNKVGTALPDEARQGNELFAKLTATPRARQQLNISYRNRPNRVDQAALDSTTAPSIATTTDNGSRIGTADWSWFASNGSSVDVRYLYTSQENEDTPITRLGYLPSFDPANLAAMGQYTDTTPQGDLKVGGNQYTNVQNYRRHELRGTFTRVFDLGRATNTLKAGIGYEFDEEQFNRVANGWGLITSLNVNGVPALRARYYTPQPPQLGQGTTYSLFVQDQVTIGPRTSWTAGVLLNRDQFSETVRGTGGCPASIALKGGPAVYESNGDTCNFLRFGFGDEIQPRLGFAYQLRKRGDKVYANWGRYYNMDQKSTGRSLAPARIFQTETVFDLTGAVLSSGPLASTTGKLIDPDLKPFYSDETLVGYATPFGGIYTADVSWVARSMHNFIEDLPSQLSGTSPTSGPFVAANLPCTRFPNCQQANARRTYRALTIDVRRTMANKVAADVSYAWSRFQGNYDLDYAPVAVFNTSSIIQDGPGVRVEDPNRFGPLVEDRPHMVKAFVAYTPAERVTLSSYLRVQSGTPWNARGRDAAGGVLNYLEPAGSHRNPAWTTLDLMAAYRLPLSGRANVSVEARLLNAFNTQTRLSTDSQQYLDLRTISTPPYFAPYLQPNPLFGTGNSFAPPRRLYLASVITF